MPWGDFMMLNYISIHLFSPEINFVPLKLDPRAKEGRRKSSEFFVAVFKTKELQLSVLSAAWTGSRRELTFDFS